MGLVCSVNVSGTATGATCVSYSNCNTTCCTKSDPAAYCAGTNDHACTAGTQISCDADECCVWSDGNCLKRNCGLTTPRIAYPNCIECGCEATGDCTKKTCAALATTNLLLCAGCGNCSGTATLSGAVDLRSYWSVTARVFSTTNIGDSLTMDATYVLGLNNAI